MDKKLKQAAFFIIVMLLPLHVLTITLGDTEINNKNIVDSIEWFEKGKSLSRSGHYEDAIVVLNKAIELNPRNAEALNGRGITHYYRQQYDKAIDDYTKAIKMDPNLAKIYYNRGIAYTNKNQYDRAIEDFTEAIKLDSTFAFAYLNRGNVYLIQQHHDKAIDDYTKVIELKPKMAEAFHTKARLDSPTKKAYIRL